MDLRGDWKRVKRAVEAWFLSQTAESDPEKLKAIHASLGPSLYKNLLATVADIAALVEAREPRSYQGAGGAQSLITLLESTRFSESKLREVSVCCDTSTGVVFVSRRAAQMSP